MCIMWSCLLNASAFFLIKFISFHVKCNTSRDLWVLVLKFLKQYILLFMNWTVPMLFQKYEHKSSQISWSHVFDVKCKIFDDERSRSSEKTTPHNSPYSYHGTVITFIFFRSQRRKVAKYDAEEAELLKKEQEAEASEEAMTKRVNAAVEELLAARIALE